MKILPAFGLRMPGLSCHLVNMLPLLRPPINSSNWHPFSNCIGTADHEPCDPDQEPCVNGLGLFGEWHSWSCFCSLDGTVECANFSSLLPCVQRDILKRFDLEAKAQPAAAKSPEQDSKGTKKTR